MKIQGNTNRYELLCRVAGLGFVMLLIFSGCAGSGRAVVIQASAGAETESSSDSGAGADSDHPSDGKTGADSDHPSDGEAGADSDHPSDSETGADPDHPAEEDLSAAGIVVHICGQVENPGVYELPEGSRVWDGVQAAGGFSVEADPDAVNLAAPLSDGSKVTIPSCQEADGQEDWYEEGSRPEGKEALTGSGQPGTVDGLIDINQASVSQLTEIPGIGQVRAEAITAYREAHGPFHTVEDIMKVTGIKEGLFEKMKGYITVGG